MQRYHISLTSMQFLPADADMMSVRHEANIPSKSSVNPEDSICLSGDGQRSLVVAFRQLCSELPHPNLNIVGIVSVQ